MSTKVNIYEDAIRQLMLTPEGQDLTYKCYLGWDVIQACVRFEASEEWQSIKYLLEKHETFRTKALDLGAGNGIGSYALAKMGYQVFSVEPNPGALVGSHAILKIIQETKLNIHCINALGEYLPLESSSLSLVYCRQVLHHANNLSSLLSEVSRVLKKNGILFATREHVVDDQVSLEEFQAKHPLNKYSILEHAYKLSEYISAIQCSGLEIKRIIGPWSSVINYYPSTSKQRKALLAQKFTNLFGSMGRFVQYIPFIDYIYKKYLGWVDRTPGRMYSIIARKA